MSIRWEEVRLSDAPLQIIDGDRGSNYPKKEDFYDNEYCLFLNTKNLTLNGFDFTECQFITKEKDEKLRKGKLKRNDLVLTTRGTLGNIAFYDNKIPYEHIRINSGMVIIRPEEEKISPLFISFLFENMRDEFLAIGSGSAQPQLPIKDLKNITIKLPPLKEQEKIAEILSSCNEHIKNLKNLKSELEKEKLHLMNELLSGKTRFANFTTPWQEVALKDLGEYRRGSFPQPYGNKEWYDGEGSMPFVQVFDVDDNFKLKPTTLKRISKLAQPKSIFIPKGSVIITIQGSIGRTAITQYDCYLDRTLLYFEKFLIPIDKKFFMYALFSVFEVEKLKAPGGTIKTITKEALSDFKIKLPSLEEQKKIGEVLSACDERLQCLNELITAQTTLKSHLLTELLSGNLRVKDF